MSAEPSAFFMQARTLRTVAGPRHVANKAVGGAVVDRRRPVLVHWRIRRDNQAISLAAVKILPVLVFDGQQVKLSFAEMLGREEGKDEYKASAVDRICIRIGKGVLRGLEVLGLRREGPAADVK
jgi:hypothetical protein